MEKGIRKIWVTSILNMYVPNQRTVQIFWNSLNKINNIFRKKLRAD